MGVRLQPFALVDGAVMHPSVTRSDVVRAMAAHLFEKDAFGNENDAVRSLMWCGKFSPYDVMVLVSDARQVAYQQTVDVVAREVGKP